MADGLTGAPLPEDDEEELRKRALWYRRVALGLMLAAILVVLLAGVVGDVFPGASPIAQPGPGPTVSMPGPGLTTAPSPTPTSAPTATGGDTNNPNGSNPGSSTAGAPGANPTKTGNEPNVKPPPQPTRTPTTTPTPTERPTLPVTGPDHCVVPGGGAGPPNYCVTRQLLVATVTSGHLFTSNGVGPTITGTNASRVKLGIGGQSFGEPSVAGAIPPLVVTDTRGVDAGWSLVGEVVLPQGVPPGLLITVDPWCRAVTADSAPGVHAGAAGQTIDSPAVLCAKDDQVGGASSTGGAYQVGGTVTVSAWRGTPIPMSSLVITLILA